MKTNEFEASKGTKEWLDAMRRWQGEWKALVDETGIVPVIGGIYGLTLMSEHGIDGPAELKFRQRPKRAKT